MKFAAIFLIVVFLCQGGSAKPFISGIIGSISKGIKDGIDRVDKIVSDTSKSWGDITNGIITKISEASKGAFNAGADFVTKMANGMASLTTTAAERFSNLTKSIQNTINNVGNDGGNTFKKISTEIKNRIDSVKSNVEEVLVDVEKKYNEGLLKLNETLLEDTKKIDNIAKELKDKYTTSDLTDEQKDKIDQLINEYILKGTNEISKCSKEIVEPMQGLYNDTIDSINDVLPTIQKVVDDMQKCVEQAGRMQLVKCAVEAKKGLPTVSTMADFIANMRKEVEKYNFKDLIDLTCINETWKNMNQLRDELENNLKQVVNKNSQ